MLFSKCLLLVLGLSGLKLNFCFLILCLSGLRFGVGTFNITVLSFIDGTS